MTQYTKVDSSMIDLVGYDADTEILEVRFINTGLTYEYYDVPKKIYKQLMESDSKGSYMRDCIFDCYDYDKIKGGRRKQNAASDRPKRNPLKPFIGEYEIHEMPDFDNEYLNMDGDPTFTINEDGSGEFHFGLVTGHFQGKIKEKNDDEVFTFKWTGNDECDEAPFA
jgi:KTSC domain